MRIAVAGSQGLIGNALVNSLRAAGHTVIRLVRREALADDEFSWDPETIGMPPESLEGVDAVVSLGGVGVGNGRWTGRFKQELRDSRITPTEVLAEAVRDLGIPTFISASATGFYGDTGTRAAVETDGPGKGFLAELVVDWEKAATTNAGPDTRVVLLRTAPVLSSQGGLLGKLRPLFKLGLGGPIGNGKQYFSWISLIDEVRAIEFLLDSPDIAGPVNLSAPGSLPFGEFCKALGKAVHRLAVMQVPEFVARRVGGEMAEEMILFSQRVEPRVLTDHGFTFNHPEIREALTYATKPAS
ncbi:TIGR01777 family oxidoreductase [Gordonia alkanivorans]|uniref:TIGR01777 family oxidoreductase n=1 Tax=Gordonia alkanivorans TaxID=84096 RepID=UPI0024474F81|nr:TIGR01777 family oxidoreductase [Gordonia alkanivorans]MDH3007903.1 TIGR01777 family oxidoreductase [Gordonia alkanivorans]MDH3011975.1 TIGR01777 family oxidoreductase [Gordonia alkanivorans]MDH3024988.1 TIGR01777 family oxidoreductase [Gordonia alkanivorans]MDH3046077.1 TIGR01777 family oxidoreductase [Gordonia alkanivorans]MDH3049808.1 TIGR01777 family oxidoreductase [Gordonia alkanivorans]